MMKSDSTNPEDILIRRLFVGGAVATILGFLALATVVAVMISFNFNILEWME